MFRYLEKADKSSNPSCKTQKRQRIEMLSNPILMGNASLGKQSIVQRIMCCVRAVWPAFLLSSLLERLVYNTAAAWGIERDDLIVLLSATGSFWMSPRHGPLSTCASFLKYPYAPG